MIPDNCTSDPPTLCSSVGTQGHLMNWDIKYTIDVVACAFCK
jgi:hypothetical protein